MWHMQTSLLSIPSNHRNKTRQCKLQADTKHTCLLLTTDEVSMHDPMQSKLICEGGDPDSLGVGLIRDILQLLAKATGEKISCTC